MTNLSTAYLPAIAALLLLPVLAHAQAPTAPTSEKPVAATAAEPAPRRLLLKVGLAPSRLIPQYRWHGTNWTLAPSVGAEYQLTPHLTLYGQAEVDFVLVQRRYSNYAFGLSRERMVHSGAVGIGGRYYYNQERRAQHNRAHGPFVGNYVALEAAAELDRREFVTYDPYSSYYPTVYSVDYRTQVMPVLTALWGLQRRLGQHFLYDASAGLVVLARPVTYNYYGPSYFKMLYGFETSLALNLRVYLVH
ncbi:hypothetical protein Q3A66_04865 [Hymenobacter sp. BT770]|uniref:hypothetical protein n=1 Tax=Hymenobacter sp. BT770 TaxID=2886942 RepID=UPI001D0F540C|nr:hypothetical protein [Hymenobacter sp. BT770]MCC3154165.1 hypothetical protein [Hymenobacter sp. BT770]MDO3414388.1 hypothetical protein [Hymenobacter sp. BT770]